MPDQPAPQQLVGRRRDDSGCGRPVANERDVDGVFALAGDQLAGAVERIDEQERAADRAWMRTGCGLFRHHGHARQQARQSVEDDGFGGFVGSGDRRAIRLVAMGQGRAAYCGDDSGGTRRDQRQAVEQAKVRLLQIQRHDVLS